MPPDVDPTAFQLALILTAAGATVAATVIAAVIELAKKIPVVGPWIDAKREPGIAVLLSFGLVVYAYLATTPTVDPINGFAAFLAFIGVAGLATKSYDVAVSVKASMTGAG